MKKIIIEDIMPIAENTYFKMRNREECIAQIEEKNNNLKRRIDRLDKIKELKINDSPIKKIPDNESQVALLLATLLRIYIYNL
ncbi:hypothetical protein LJE39_08755 [Clostridium butyricum]|uniref:hypothetical protein n=1 Tax=Clostridium butyricum TaxID=1492 RepID=UPI0021C3708C|nr:hypothetical protein [Clostridium butyricum]MCQ2013249.1 hypothetical protein [Clostridium butyricum]